LQLSASMVGYRAISSFGASNLFFRVVSHQL
jgi:hypothetical protein